MRIRPPALARVATSVLVIAATGCAHDSTPINPGQASTSASATVLPPNDRGYVRIELATTSVNCSVNVELVACQRFSGSWHDANGQIQHTASVNTGGEFHWVNADLGELQGRVPLGFQPYTAQGWTILARPGDTRFVNDRSGHGMTVDAEHVTPF